MAESKYLYKDGKLEKGKIKIILKDKGSGYIEVDEHDDIKFNFSDFIDKTTPEVGISVEFKSVDVEGKFIAHEIKSTTVNKINYKDETINNSTEYFLPKDTRKNIQPKQVENFALKFNKYASFEESDKKFKFYKTGKGIYNDLDFNKIPFNKIPFNKIPFNKIPFNKINSESLIVAKSLFGDNHKVIKMETDWRLAIGLGNESVYGTSMTLHPIYGIPYIPGQAVKGITRSWIINESFESNEGEALSQSEVFCKIFGCPKDISIEKRDKEGNLILDQKGKPQKQKYTSKLEKDYQGSIIFFDVFPLELKTDNLKVDVMNPHYSDYYSNKGGNNPPPADYYNPVPIYFLTVEKTSFQFIIGIKEKDNYNADDKQLGKGKLLDITEKYLNEALQNQGIGAKSAVGYGYFKI